MPAWKKVSSLDDALAATQRAALLVVGDDLLLSFAHVFVFVFYSLFVLDEENWKNSTHRLMWSSELKKRLGKIFCIFMPRMVSLSLYAVNKCVLFVVD